MALDVLRVSKYIKQSDPTKIRTQRRELDLLATVHLDHFSQCHSHAHVRSCPTEARLANGLSHLQARRHLCSLQFFWVFFFFIFFPPLSGSPHREDRFQIGAMAFQGPSLVPCDGHSRPPNYVSTSLSANLHSQSHIAKSSTRYLFWQRSNVFGYN